MGRCRALSAPRRRHSSPSRVLIMCGNMLLVRRSGAKGDYFVCCEYCVWDLMVAYTYW